MSKLSSDETIEESVQTLGEQPSQELIMDAVKEENLYTNYSAHCDKDGKFHYSIRKQLETQVTGLFPNGLSPTTKDNMFQASPVRQFMTELVSKPVTITNSTFDSSDTKASTNKKTKKHRKRKKNRGTKKQLEKIEEQVSYVEDEVVTFSKPASIKNIEPDQESCSTILFNNMVFNDMVAQKSKKNRIRSRSPTSKTFCIPENHEMLLSPALPTTRSINSLSSIGKTSKTFACPPETESDSSLTPVKLESLHPLTDDNQTNKDIVKLQSSLTQVRSLTPTQAVSEPFENSVQSSVEKVPHHVSNVQLKRGAPQIVVPMKSREAIVEAKNALKELGVENLDDRQTSNESLGTPKSDIMDNQNQCSEHFNEHCSFLEEQERFIRSLNDELNIQNKENIPEAQGQPKSDQELIERQKNLMENQSTIIKRVIDELNQRPGYYTAIAAGIFSGMFILDGFRHVF